MVTSEKKKLPRQNRIASRKDFLQIQSSGRKYRSQFFLLVLSEHRRPSLSGPDSRIGITVTRKVDKRAVARNKLRRRLKEVFRDVRPQLKKAVDIVVIAHNGACALEFDKVREEFLQLLKKSRLL